METHIKNIKYKIKVSYIFIFIILLTLLYNLYISEMGVKFFIIFIFLMLLFMFVIYTTSKINNYKEKDNPKYFLKIDTMFTTISNIIIIIMILITFLF